MSDAHTWLDLLRHYRAGHLYVAGGVADQPNVYTEAMGFLESVAARANDK